MCQQVDIKSPIFFEFIYKKLLIVLWRIRFQEPSMDILMAEAAVRLNSSEFSIYHIL
jgi:hypothetical protein